MLAGATAGMHVRVGAPVGYLMGRYNYWKAFFLDGVTVAGTIPALTYAVLSLILVDTAPGNGPSLHRHQYDEVFIVQEGEATFSLGDAERTVTAGHVVVVPAGEPHGFTSSGEGRLRLVAIHLSPRMVTEWLES